MRRFIHPISAVIVALALLALLAGSALADQRLDGKVRFADDVLVPAGETVPGNLYLYGQTVDVAGHVVGDLVAAGGTVTISGTVDGDVLVGGGTVTVSGMVHGDVRVGGGEAIVSGPVDGDVAIAGGTATISGSVGGDVLVAAGTATVSGSIAGSIAGAAGNYTRTGSLGGSEDVRITAPQQPVASPAPSSGTVALDAVRHFVVVLLFGGLALWLFPQLTRATEQESRRRPLPALGAGILAIAGFVAVWIAVAIVMVVLGIIFGALTLGTAVGIEVVAGLLLLGVVTLGFSVAVAFLVDAVVGLATVRFILPVIGVRMDLGRWQEFGAMAVGAAVVVILSSLPVAGWFVKLIVVCLGLGAIALATWAALRPTTGPRAPTAAVSSPS